MRVGFGFDVHRTGGGGPLKLAGIEVADDQGLIGTSDADVAVHALIDALLGAAALGDIGTYFPSSDPRWEGADSLDLLRDVVATVGSAGYQVGSVDLTVVAQNVRVAPHREAMRSCLAEVLGLSINSVSVKATTTDALGFLGREEGIGATAVAVIQPA
jgi:2-C-methyl-D-erythritol 2,4-cyclodiphosphate synthase